MSDSAVKKRRNSSILLTPVSSHFIRQVRSKYGVFTVPAALSGCYLGENKQNMSYQTNDNASARNFGWGIFWLLGGIIGTIATSGHVLFYGAILVGTVRFIRGIAQSS